MKSPIQPIFPRFAPRSAWGQILSVTLPFCLAWNCTAGFTFFEPVQPPRTSQVMVHRGEAMQAPENTKPALERCIQDYLEWAEVDLRLTQDGQHILSHGASVTDSSGATWKIADHSLAELGALDVGAAFAKRYTGVHLLSLKDCFALCKGKLNLYLDCKAINPEQLAREILDAGMEQQVIVYADLKELQQVSAVGQGKIATMTKWHPKLGGVDWAVQHGLAAVEVDAPELTAADAKSFHEAGIKVEAKVLGDWDKAEIWDQVIVAGADYLQTDLPAEIVAHELWRRCPNRPVEISCHRGANRYAPENTLPAFAKAVRLGVNYVEFDVRPTKDGTYFLLHDSRLNRTTDGAGPIDEATTAEVRKLSAGVNFGRPCAKTPVPTMEEFMTQFAGKIGFYFDAKAIPPEAIAEALERYKMVDHSVVYQSAAFLTKLKAVNPKIRALPPLRRPEDIDNLAATLKPYGVDTEWDILSKDLIARVHAAGIKVFSDAMGEHERVEDYQQAMDWGIDVIQTDYPLRVMRAIELRMNGQK